MCVCVCAVIPFILDVRLVDAPAEVTQEEGHKGFLYLPSAVLSSIFFARGVQPSLSLLDCEVEVLYPRHSRSPFVGHHVMKNPSSCYCAKIRTYVPTSEGFEVTN